MTAHKRESYLGTPQAKRYQHSLEEQRAEIERLEAEIERLRAALVRIAGGGEKYDSASHLMQIARSALERK